MPEYLVTLRNNTTGGLFDVHVCNVNSVDEAINLASSEDYLSETTQCEYQIEYSELLSDLSLDCPF